MSHDNHTHHNHSHNHAHNDEQFTGDAGERRTYYVSVGAGQVLEDQHAATYELVIQATADEVNKLKELFGEYSSMDEAEAFHFTRNPYETNDDRALSGGTNAVINQIYNLLHELGTERYEAVYRGQPFALEKYEGLLSDQQRLCCWIRTIALFYCVIAESLCQFETDPFVTSKSKCVSGNSYIEDRHTHRAEQEPSILRHRKKLVAEYRIR